MDYIIADVFTLKKLQLSHGSDTVNGANLNKSYYVQWKYQDPPEFHPFWFEQIDYNSWKEYAAINWLCSFYTSLLYLIIIFSLKLIMKNRQPFKLKWLLITWNSCLGLLSFMGFLRIGQEMLNILSMPNGLHTSICSRVGLNPPAAFYSVIFALSKFLELGDTILIVLTKRPLIFLQWYHHCASLILAWQVMPYSEPIFRWYGVMNYGIHSVMYSYFALKVLGRKVSRKVAMLITALQLLQMVVGVGMNVYSVHILNLYGPDSCARDPVSIKWIGSVYASFMILFVHFFYERYLVKKAKIS